jgi:hypothetical protein
MEDFFPVVPPPRNSLRKNEALDNMIKNNLLTIGGRKKQLNGDTEVQ